MKKSNYARVWEAIEEAPEEVQDMKLRSRLMAALVDVSGLNQAQAVKQFGLTQSRISKLMRGKIKLFRLDAMVNTTAAARPVVQLQRDDEMCASHEMICT